MNTKEWLNDINSTIKDLLKQKPSKDIVMFLSALFSVKNELKEHEFHEQTIINNIPESEVEYIEDELKGANDYYNLYRNTGDVDFLQMAYDEATHAKKFIYESDGDTTGYKEKLNIIMHKINQSKNSI